MNPKILHIIDSGGLYGAEIMLLNLVEEQIALGLKPTIASIGEKDIPEKPFETEAIKRGLKLIKFRMIPGQNISGSYNLLKFAKNNNFDLIHSHGYKGNILLGFIPRFIRKIPMISTLHGYTSTSGINKMRVYEWLDTMSHRFIDSVVLVNKGMLNHPKLKNRKGIKYQIINNGISTHPITQQPNKPNNPTNPITQEFCKEGFIIGSIGRLSTEKGFTYLIDALKILIDKGVDAKLIIVGEGYERASLEQQVDNAGIKDIVLFTGYIKNAKQFMNKFHVYVISSLTEGLPITLLETMLAKIPVVATAVGGIPEVITDQIDGLLVKPCEPESLAEAFLKLYSDSELSNKLSDNAYSKLIDNYSSKKMASEYMELYSEIIN